MHIIFLNSFLVSVCVFIDETVFTRFCTLLVFEELLIENEIPRKFRHSVLHDLSNQFIAVQESSIKGITHRVWRYFINIADVNGKQVNRLPEISNTE